MAIRRAPEPERHRSRFYVGLAAFTAAMAVVALERSVRHHFIGAVTLYQLSSAPIGPNPQRWPGDHRAATNNDAFQAPTQDAGPNYLVHLPGLANSDPVLVRGTLYVSGSAGGTGDVWAIDPRSGRIRWTASLPNSTFSEPIVSGGRVFVGEGNAVFPGDPSTPATTPGTVRGTGPSALYALSAQTGALLWRFPTRYADQAPPTVAAGRVYLATGGRHLDVLDARTGRLIWRVGIPVYVSRSSPRLVDGAIDFGGAGPLEVLSVARNTHRIRWVRPIPQATGGVDDTPLAVSGGVLYTASLTALPSGFKPANPNRAAPASLPDRLFGALRRLIEPPAPDHTARIWALAARTGTILWSHPLADGPNPPYKETGTPMVHGQRLFTGNALNGRLVALDRTTGRLIWSTWLNAPVTRPPVWVNHTILVVTARGTLYRLSAGSGTVLARRPLGPFVNAYGPVIVDHTVLVTVNQSNGGFLAAIPLKTLSPRTAPLTSR